MVTPTPLTRDELFGQYTKTDRLTSICSEIKDKVNSVLIQNFRNIKDSTALLGGYLQKEKFKMSN